MSDWYRSGRDEDQRSYGDDGEFGLRRREPYGRDRWSERNDERIERRSFDEDEGRFAGYGGYGGYGGPGWAPRREGAPGSAYGRQDFGGRYAYGGTPRGSERGRGVYGGAYAGTGRYGETGPYGAPVGGNAQVSRVADGDFEPSLRERFGGEGRRFGEHRGKGPKGYTRSDERIKEDVSDRLADDAWLDASDIDVAVKDGEVTLTGKVADRVDKRRAEDLAEDVSGVKQVQCNLRVERKTGQTTQFGATSPITGQTTGDGQRRPAGTA